MSIVKMTGISIVARPSKIEKLSRKLLAYGFFEPMPLDVMLDGKTPTLRVKQFRENPYDVSLEKVRHLWQLAGMEPPDEINERSPYMSPEEAEEYANSIVKKLDEWAAWSERLNDSLVGLEGLIKLEESLVEVGRSIEDMDKAEWVSFSVGSLLVDNWNRFCEISSASPIIVRPLKNDYSRVLAVVLYPREYTQEAHKLFDTVHFQEFDREKLNKLGELGGLAYMRDKYTLLKKSVSDRGHYASMYIMENRQECERAYSAISAMQRVYSLLQLRGELAGMLVISGFVPSEKVEEIRRTVYDIAPDVVFVTEDEQELAKHSRIPTLMRNNVFVRLFHEIVKMYSLPSYGELDPSPVVAFSFCLFFGMMFGDVGHGFALALGAWWLEHKGVMSGALSSVIRVAGVVSMGFGFLYGSVFGDEKLLTPLWVSPMNDVNNLISVSIVIGVVFLSLGLAFHLVNLYRKRDWGEFFFSADGLAGLLFYWVALFAVFRGMAAVPFGGRIVNWMLGITLGTLFIVILGGQYLTRWVFHRESENDGIVHVFSIFHAMLSFLSNTASFVRLAAFALNHAGLSAAVYMLADMVKETPGGRFTTLFVLLIGHIVIVGLEGLIVFIQTLRLEYYEFFSKFYIGGGRMFSPIAWKK